MRGRLGAVIGLVLISLGAILLADRLGYLAGLGAFGWTLVFAVVGLAFLALAVGRRRVWWAALPACFFLSLAGLVFTTVNDLLPGEVAAAGFLFCGLALPFWLILVFQGRSAWWAAVPAGVLTFVALGVGLEPVVGGEWTGALILWGIAVPFWVVYLLDRERWWALIPAGVLTTVGLLPPVAEVWPPHAVVAVLFGGLGGTFLLVYLLSGLRRDLAWALWPAGVCGLLALLALLIFSWLNLAGAVLMIAGGVALLVFILLRGRS